MNILLAHPAILFFLVAIAIPIIVHLFNFRRFKKVYFTNVRFLFNLVKETDSKSKLKHLLVLACRILIVAILVGAFAQPYIPFLHHQKNSASQTVHVYVDNSYSMSAEGQEGGLLDQAKRKAEEVVLAFKENTQFQIITNDFLGAQQRFYNRPQAIEKIEEIKQSAKVQPTNQVIKRMTSMIGRGAKQLYLISDFQKTTTSFSQPAMTDSSAILHLISMKQNQFPNVSIDSCWLSSPIVRTDEMIEISVKLKVFEDKPSPKSVPVKLIVNGSEKALTNADFKDGTVAECKLQYRTSVSGWQSVQVSIKDYPITFDNDYYFSFCIPPSLQVVSINESSESPYLNALFGKNDSYKFSNMSVGQIDFSRLSSSQFIILNELKQFSSGLRTFLTQFVSKGGSVVILPSPTADIQTYNSFIATVDAREYKTFAKTEDKIDKIETQSAFYTGVFEKIPDNSSLPKITGSYSFNSNLVPKEEVLLKTRLGNGFLNKYDFKRGHTYLFACPLNVVQSNFPEHAIFVPTFIRMALLAANINTYNYNIASGDAIVLPSNTAFQEGNLLVTDGKKVNIIPEKITTPYGIVLNVAHQVTNAGLYQVVDNAHNELLTIGYNDDRRESDIDQYSVSELEEMMNKAHWAHSNVLQASGKELTTQIEQENEGKPLWKWCIVAVLILLAIETMLLRLFR